MMQCYCCMSTKHTPCLTSAQLLFNVKDKVWRKKCVKRQDPNEGRGRLGCYTESTGKTLRTFRRILMLSLSRSSSLTFCRTVRCWRRMQEYDSSKRRQIIIRRNVATLQKNRIFIEIALRTSHFGWEQIHYPPQLKKNTSNSDDQSPQYTRTSNDRILSSFHPSSILTNNSLQDLGPCHGSGG
jgi:hypothetical protein